MELAEAFEPGDVVHRIETTDNLDLLLQVLPERIRTVVEASPGTELLEIVLDLGRLPETRYPNDARTLSQEPVTREDIAHTVSRLGSFTSDNRAGIEGTLHRIAALRNRRGEIIGLTLRVGRAVTGTIAIVRDVIAPGRSVLLLGRPGVGKTTLLREAARVLADEEGKRVVIVDTSNEIAGDGDVPHPGIGKARRLQVPEPRLQHAVMIEAVENHMPEVVVVDEIGTHEEALAARTIAERGVQLIGTAHGTTLENLIANPTLADLVGGIESVTLGDEEARRRRTQKTILERKAPPTFDLLIEIQERYRFAIHKDVARAVDSLLMRRSPTVEIRKLTAEGTLQIDEPRPTPRPGRTSSSDRPLPAPAATLRESPPRRIFPYAVSISRLARALRRLGLTASVTHHLPEADLLLTLRAQERRQPAKILEAEQLGIPIRTVRSNTQAQIEKALAGLFANGEDQDLAVSEAQQGVQVVIAENRPVELEPRSSALRRVQHLIAQEHGLVSDSTGHEPHRRVTLYPPLAPERPV